MNILEVKLDKMIKGECYICDDDTNRKWTSFVQIGDRWNGWYQPFIHCDDIDDFIQHYGLGKDQLECEFNIDVNVLTMVDGLLVVESWWDGKLVESFTVEPTYIDGKLYYYINIGLIFDFDADLPF